MAHSLPVSPHPSFLSIQLHRSSTLSECDQIMVLPLPLPPNQVIPCLTEKGRPLAFLIPFNSIPSLRVPGECDWEIRSFLPLPIGQKLYPSTSGQGYWHPNHRCLSWRQSVYTKTGKQWRQRPWPIRGSETVPGERRHIEKALHKGPDIIWKRLEKFKPKDALKINSCS